MSLEKTEALLSKFDYNYEKRNDQLEIKLGLGLRVTADFSKSEKILIEDKLTTWNFLSGTLDMSIRRAMVFNFVLTFILLGMLLIFLDDEKALYVLLLISILIQLLWSGYYVIKSEQMKHTLIRWNED